MKGRAGFSFRMLPPGRHSSTKTRCVHTCSAANLVLAIFKKRLSLLLRLALPATLGTRTGVSVSGNFTSCKQFRSK